jgi:hypothetical protein
MKQSLSNFLMGLGLATCLCACGANYKGPPLAEVTGTVTIDGAPIDDAEVSFQPKGARMSLGNTDSQGKYRMRFTMDKYGAAVGSHRVMITTARTASGGEGVPEVKARKELLPAKYHSKSELVAEVAPGSNVIDFALTTK